MSNTCLSGYKQTNTLESQIVPECRSQYCLRIFFLLLLSSFPVLGSTNFDSSNALNYIERYENISLKEKVKYITVNAYIPDEADNKKNKTEKVKLNFYYHVPASYDPEAPHKYRVLVYCLYNGSSGEMGAAGKRVNFNRWADKHGILVLCLGGNNIKGWKHPEIWSGKALTRALRKLRRMYNIRSDRLLFYGFSAGSETSNLFAAEYSKQTVAYVSHGCGQFHEPSRKMKNVPALITCGDADDGRYAISRHFTKTYPRIFV